jgi:hypothetical protein
MARQKGSTAISSAAFFNSITPNGKPLTKITRSGRRLYQPHNFRADAAVLAAALDDDATHEQPMEGAVNGNEGRMLRDGDFVKGFVQHLGGQLGIHLAQRDTETFRQKCLAKTCPLGGGFARGDNLTVEQRIIQFAEP